MSDSVARINSAVDEFLGLCTGGRSAELDLRVYLVEAERLGKLTGEEAPIVEATIKRILFDRSQLS